MIKMNLDDLQSKNPKVKYACSKLAIKISTEKPSELYGDFDLFRKLLESDNNIMVWTALRVIGNLSGVDTLDKIDKLIPRLFESFHSERMITSANAIAALGSIAKNKQKQRDKIIKELLQVEKLIYKIKDEISPECRNIAIGHALNAFKDMGDAALKRQDVKDFIERQTSNSRPSVAKRAKGMLTARARNI